MAGVSASFSDKENSSIPQVSIRLPPRVEDLLKEVNRCSQRSVVDAFLKSFLRMTECGVLRREDADINSERECECYS